MNLPINIEDLINARVIESERLDFKEGFNDEALIKSISAFANDIHNLGGGYIIIGIEDDKNGRPVLPPKGLEVSQIDAYQKKIVELCHKIEPVHFPIIQPALFMDKHILILWATGGDHRPYKAPVSMGKGANKEYFVRHGSSTKIATPEEEKQLLELAARIPFDDRVNQLAKVDDLDILQIKSYLQETGSDLYHYIESMKLEDIYKSMHLVKGTDEQLLPLNISLLLFSKDPQKYFRTAVIDLVQFFDETGDNFTEKTFTGSIQKQLVDVLSYIDHQVIKKRVQKVDGQAEANVYYNYPFAAIEEALANAVYHKGYDVNEPIEVRIFPDRIEIVSYPGPIPPVTNDTLQKGRVVARRYRNRRIGDFLKELKLTEGRGTGLLKIKKSMDNNGSDKAVFDTDDSTYFVTTLPIHPKFIHERVSSDIKLNINIDAEEGLSRDQVKILKFCNSKKSLADIMGLFERTNRTKFRDQVINRLLDAQLLIMTIPDKPTSSKQKYKTTNLGNNKL